jgi:hypothetical protein
MGTEGRMKKLTLDQWEEKYISGPVTRFDQKYTMFNRPSWDPEIHGLLEDRSFTGEVKDKPGYTGWLLSACQNGRLLA